MLLTQSAYVGITHHRVIDPIEVVDVLGVEASPQTAVWVPKNARTTSERHGTGCQVGGGGI